MGRKRLHVSTPASVTLLVRFLRILTVCLSAACFASDFAEQLYKAGEKAEKAGDTLHAYLLFSRASALDPKNVAYAERKTATRTIAALSAREELGPDPAATEEGAPAATGEISDRELTDARQALPPPRLILPNEKKTFNLKGDAREIFEKVAEAYGFQVVFDADYQSPPPFTFRMTDATYEDALRALESVSNSFLVPVNPRLALVARDTPQKRTERSPTMTAAIPIPERMTVQDAQEMMTAVQQMLDIRRATMDPGRHVVFMRDQAAKVLAAQQLFANLSHFRPQVEVDVEFLSVDKTSSLGYGLSLPNQFSIVNFQGPLSLPNAYRALTRLTGMATPYGLGIAEATAFATLARSSAVNLLDAQIVSLDGQQATLHVGDRYPIITNQYVGSTAGQTGQVYAPPPTITFEDLGLVLKITPSVHEDDEMTLDVDAEFKTLGAASSVSGIPIIASNTYTAKVRLKNGEWAVIAGLIQLNDSETRTGYPGLMRIPILGRLFGTTNTEHDKSDVLLVLKPHLIALPPWETVQRPLWVGTETRPVTIF